MSPKCWNWNSINLLKSEYDEEKYTKGALRVEGCETQICCSEGFRQCSLLHLITSGWKLNTALGIKGYEVMRRGFFVSFAEI